MSTAGASVGDAVGVGVAAVGVGVGVASPCAWPSAPDESDAMPSPVTPVTVNPPSTSLPGLIVGRDALDETVHVTTTATIATKATATAASEARRMSRARD